MQGFGARLREARERQRVSLTSISAETKIKVTLLEALERDDVSQWPQGIFRRAYVRSYAQAIGLDPNTVLREFLELYPDPAEAPPEATEEVSKPQPMAGLRRLIDAAIGAVPVRQPAGTRQQAETRHSPPPEIRQHAKVEYAPPVADSAEAVVPSEPMAPREPVGPPALALTLDYGGRADSVPNDPGDNPDQNDPDLKTADVQPSVPGAADPERPGLWALADVCTRLAQAGDSHELSTIFTDAACMLEAVGLVVWSCDTRAAVLHPWLAHGYSEAVLAQLPAVSKDADNAIAAAFRSAETCVVKGEGGQTGALVVPIRAPRGCVGVLALELRSGDEERDAVRAAATILAAQLGSLVGTEPLVKAVNA